MSIKVGFISLGCNKNLCDTENMIGILAEKGFEITNNPEDADVCVVNTCGFIESAKQESIDTLLEMAKLKEDKCKLLVACGCLAQRYSAEIQESLPEVDVIIGTTAIDDIATGIEEGLKNKKVVSVKDIDIDIPENLPRVLTTPSYVAYIKIAEGCDNRCTYCAIPYIRGKYRSRPMENIINEAIELAKNGVREIILVAQDTTRYGIDLYGEKKLSLLLKKLCAIKELEWVRVHYCYPEELDDKLIQTIKEEDKIVKYLDIPVQHGCDTVLKRMGRKTNGKSILSLVEKLRHEIPEIVLRTSIIVGFPGETEEEFTELLEFLDKAKFDRAGVFEYSCEEGTPASKLKNQIDEDTKHIRYEKAMELLQEISFRRNEKMIGKTLKVICEGFEDNLYYGRSGGESIEIDPKIYFGAHRELIAGDFTEVVIKSYDMYDLYGEEEEDFE